MTSAWSCASQSIVRQMSPIFPATSLAAMTLSVALSLMCSSMARMPWMKSHTKRYFKRKMLWGDNHWIYPILIVAVCRVLCCAHSALCLCFVGHLISLTFADCIYSVYLCMLSNVIPRDLPSYLQNAETAHFQTFGYIVRACVVCVFSFLYLFLVFFLFV